jgi:hypothetical protein
LAQKIPHVIETFTTEDKTKTDSAGHKLIRDPTTAPIKTEDEILFTTKYKRPYREWTR